MNENSVDYRDVQGIVRFGYGRLTEASFLLLRIKDPEAAKIWLRNAPISNAVACDSAPVTALQIAFTSSGLARLGLPEAVMDEFSIEFRSGMSQDAGRSRLLGDIGANAPQCWNWGGPDQELHLLLMVYAQPGHLQEWTAVVKGAAWEAAFELAQLLSTSDAGGVEHFGFADSLSQPVLDWDDTKDTGKSQRTYNNISSLGEFLLGYPNEYGRYTERPLLQDASGGEVGLSTAPDAPGMLDLGRNGSYLVLRTLEQDVHGFWSFVSKQVNADADARENLASLMVGRRRDGTPLVKGTEEAIPGIAVKDASRNQFTFDSDAEGIRCPLGAHIRRANPRNADMPTPTQHGLAKVLQTVGLGPKTLHSDAKASTRFHRIIRRGRTYGSAISVEEAIAQSTDDGSRGIHFICLVANIVRQFEFLQGSWLMSSKFDALKDEADPLLGNREAVSGAITDEFSRQQEDGVCLRMAGLPRFVTVKGGAYFFLPSLSAIRYLATMPADKTTGA